jgi:O-antigen chain-terminating methyltransferase
MRWYVEPALAQQREFNAAVLRALDETSERMSETSERLSERLDQAFERLARSEERLAETSRALEAVERGGNEQEERLVRLERRVRRDASGAAPAAAASPSETSGAADPPDYFAFEARMRGPRDLVRERQSVYVDDFFDASPVVDLGCGRGEFLELMREAGVEATGVDFDMDMVEECRANGLKAEPADVLGYLGRLDDRSLGGIFSAHLIEHLTPAVLFQLLELAAAKLRAGGLLVVETPNPLSLYALANFWSDLSHAQPLHPATLEFLVHQAGFRETELRFLGDVPEHERLRRVPLPADGALAGAREALDADVDRLNDVVFGPQDYAVVART